MTRSGRLASSSRVVLLVLGTLMGAAGTMAQDMTPPSRPGDTDSPSCVSFSANTCLVEDEDFTIQVSPSIDEPGGSGVNTTGYQVCRSHDTTGWGGCDVSMTVTGTTTFVVTGSHRPAPGHRRAYYFRGRDHAGNWSDWNNELYVQTLEPVVDPTPPSRPGATTSPSCVSFSGDTCFVEGEDFTIQVSPSIDEPGGSGVNTTGYQVCRSQDAVGWGGCNFSMTVTGTTTFVVTGVDRPLPGRRRAYYFRGRDHAGNWSDWNDEMYVQTIEPADTTPPSRPGATTSPSCVSFSGNTCFVEDEDFTIQVSPSIDEPGGSGVRTPGYQVCRSHDATGWGGCNVSMTVTGTPTFVVTGSHRPAPGHRRAYYFRGRDRAGNWSDWNDEMYVQTLDPSVESRCLDSFYASIQQGNSNRLPAALPPLPFRPSNDIEHYRQFANREGLRAVKIWDALHGIDDQQFEWVMDDPTIDIVVYRPMYNFNTTTDDEQVDYGELASELYSRFATTPKVVILTGWEQDHQLDSMMANIPGFTVADYLDMIQERQNGVMAARMAASVPGCPECTVRLSVFHAVEVVQSDGPVLYSVVAQMNPKPDFISYSARGGLDSPASHLENIRVVSGLDRDHIFIGDFNWRLDRNWQYVAEFAQNFLEEVRSWGAHMAFLWQFNQGLQAEPYVVYLEPEHPTPDGFVRESSHPLWSVPVKRDLIDAVADESRTDPCSEWAW